MNKNPLFFKKLKAVMYTVLLSGAVMLTSCSDEDKEKAAGSGDAVLTLETNSNVNAITRATTERDPNAPAQNDFKIYLDSSIESKTLSYGEWESVISLKEGTYTVKAVSGDPTKEGFVGEDGFEKPWYQGDEVVEIEATKTTDINLTATLQNAKVSVKYTDEFLSYFEDYEVNVSLKSSKGSKIFIFDTEETYEPLYLIPGTLTLNVDISNAQGAVPHYEETFTISGQSHYNLTFDVEGVQTGAQLKITFVGPDTENLGEINLAD